MRIAVITPITHLNGVYDLLLTKGQIFFLEEGTKEQIRNLLIEEKIDSIFCNPNQQTYKIDKELLDSTSVSLINTCSTGMNHIDTEYCFNNNIEIYSLTKDYNLISQLPSTSELAFGLLLDLMRNITLSNNSILKTKTWDYLPFVGQQVKDYNIGIVGFGRLGKMMYKFCKAFDANVYVYDPYEVKNMDDKFLLNHVCHSLEDLFEKCDAVSLHVHVTDETKYMIDYSLLSKNVKFLVNTSRGEIVNEKDIIQCLKDGKLLGYGADVIEHEFEEINNSPFFSLENQPLNCIFTPHIGGMTIQGQTKAYKWAINKFKTK